MSSSSEAESKAKSDIQKNDEANKKRKDVSSENTNAKQPKKKVAPISNIPEKELQKFKEKLIALKEGKECLPKILEDKICHICRKKKPYVFSNCNKNGHSICSMHLDKNYGIKDPVNVIRESPQLWVECPSCFYRCDCAYCKHSLKKKYLRKQENESKTDALPDDFGVIAHSEKKNQIKNEAKKSSKKKQNVIDTKKKAINEKQISNNNTEVLVVGNEKWVTTKATAETSNGEGSLKSGSCLSSSESDSSKSSHSSDLASKKDIYLPSEEKEEISISEKNEKNKVKCTFQNFPVCSLCWDCSDEEESSDESSRLIECPICPRSFHEKCLDQSNPSKGSGLDVSMEKWCSMCSSKQKGIPKIKFYKGSDFIEACHVLLDSICHDPVLSNFILPVTKEMFPNIPEKWEHFAKIVPIKFRKDFLSISENLVNGTYGEVNDEGCLMHEFVADVRQVWLNTLSTVECGRCMYRGAAMGDEACEKWFEKCLKPLISESSWESICCLKTYPHDPWKRSEEKVGPKRNAKVKVAKITNVIARTSEDSYDSSETKHASKRKQSEVASAKKSKGTKVMRVK
mmetsp:Transcript_4494/g.6426  ORF Transcript_4494/g.6426 Transcript_4494/m.6426 type:complete len:571 (+) Transcript_4494:73-1785(+)